MRVWFSWFLALFVASAFALEPARESEGIVDSVSFNTATGLVELRGWVREPESRSALKEFLISVDGASVPVESIAVTKRADAPRDSTSLEFERDQGFLITARPESRLQGGLRAVDVVAIFTNGSQARLLNQVGEIPRIHVRRSYSRHWILMALICSIAALSYVPRVRREGYRLGQAIERRRVSVLWALVAALLLTVASGLWGSSFPIMAEGPFGSAAMETQGNMARMFRVHQDRSDEWGVLIPNVLAQIHHDPPFPVVNHHLGSDGQNMGVVGMTGVPIAQWAAIARPATWGYFFLPLRNALSWQWQLPFFGCLMLLWAFLNRVGDPRRAGSNLALAAAFCVAPYAAVWSNWPLYATLFPLASMLLVTHLLSPGGQKWIPALGAGLGVMLAGWVLVLYPPWLITVGTFCVILMGGWILDRRHALSFGMAQSIGLGIALLVAGLLLSSWLDDTKEAIALVRSTEYPGARSTLLGGDATLLWSLRGYMGPEAITFGTGPYTSQSEAGSYYFLPITMLFVAAWLSWSSVQFRWTARACLVFIGFYLAFSFIGFPVWLASITQWGRVPQNRMDLSMGLAVTVLLALLAAQCLNLEGSDKDFKLPRLLALIVAGLSALLVYVLLNEMPLEVLPRSTAVFIAAMVIAAGLTSWWLTRGRVTSAIAMILVLNTMSTIGFNPLSRAPSNIMMPQALRALLSGPDGMPARTLVVGGNGVGPMALAAAGVPLVNGVLYYPQRSLWDQIELPHRDWRMVNRYQHLGFTAGDLPSDVPYRVRSEGMDHVFVTVNSAAFDFYVTGAKRVAALENQAKLLRASAQLRELGQHKGLVVFEVVPAK